MTLAELTAAVEMLRSHGVKTYTDVAGGGFVVEFFPPQLPESKETASPVLEQRCACGHMPYEHNAGLCILGCDPIKCAPETK